MCVMCEVCFFGCVLCVRFVSLCVCVMREVCFFVCVLCVMFVSLCVFYV